MSDPRNCSTCSCRRESVDVIETDGSRTTRRNCSNSVGVADATDDIVRNGSSRSVITHIDGSRSPRTQTPVAEGIVVDGFYRE